MTAATDTRVGFWLDRVFRQATGRGMVLHELAGSMTSCHLPVMAAEHDGTRAGLVVAVESVTGSRTRYCRDCWRRHRRCVVCGAPAGQDVECGPCTAAWIATDKAVQRDGW